MSARVACGEKICPVRRVLRKRELSSAMRLRRPWVRLTLGAVVYTAAAGESESRRGREREREREDTGRSHETMAAHKSVAHVHAPLQPPDTIASVTPRWRPIQPRRRQPASCLCLCSHTHTLTLTLRLTHTHTLSHTHT